MASDTNSDVKSKAEYEKLSECIVDIKELEELEDLNVSKRNIHSVPCTLRNLEDKAGAYTPQLISIGPIHYGKKEAGPMQKQKLRYFHHFSVRVSNDKAMMNFQNFLIEKKEEICDCYEVKFESNETSKEGYSLKMLLLDAVFIMELFLRISRKEKHGDDCILKHTWLRRSIQRDLLLLENQIPFFILDELYSIVVPAIYQEHEKFIDLAYEYFKSFDPYGRFTPDDETLTQKKYSDRLMQKHGISDVKHFTDLMRTFYLNKLPAKPSSSMTIRSATKLREAGISFEKVKKKNLTRIKFNKVPILSWFLCLGCIPKFTCFEARLQIPELQVDHTTECVLRNLIAFEQCHYEEKPYVCNYVSLIDSLIQTEDDVGLLVEKEVIVHNLGCDEDVANIVNDLCENVVTTHTCYKDIIDDLNEHYESSWNRTMAALKLVYFRNAWRTSSTVIGLAVLMYTMLNFYRLLHDNYL